MSDPIVPQADVDKINKWAETAVLASEKMANARKVESYTNYIDRMNGNGTGTGASGGTDVMGNAMNMMAMNMMSQNMGMGSFFGMGQPSQAQPVQMKPASTVEEGAILGWTCVCGAVNTGRFCTECGLPKPALDGWTCSCGTVNQGKFCPNCGKKRPVGAPLYRCDKCGWEPEDPTAPPKFCPECGDSFDDSDIV